MQLLLVKYQQIRLIESQSDETCLLTIKLTVQLSTWTEQVKNTCPIVLWFHLKAPLKWQKVIIENIFQPLKGMIKYFPIIFL